MRVWVKLWVGVLKSIPSKLLKRMAGTTRLELATSAVTARNSLVTNGKHAARMALQKRFSKAWKQFVDHNWTKTIRSEPPPAGLLHVCRLNLSLPDWGGVARHRRLHPAAATGFVSTPEQKGHLWFAASRQRRNSTGSGSQPRPSRSRDRLLQRAPYLESETPTSSSCPLCRPRRRTLPRSRPLDSIPPALLPSHRRTAARVSWQVRRRSEVCFPAPRRPLLLRNRCGAVPSAAAPWLLSNDSPPHNSNSALHRSWPQLHEITHPHTARSCGVDCQRTGTPQGNG
jgi:hypothetical protein